MRKLHKALTDLLWWPIFTVNFTGDGVTSLKVSRGLTKKGSQWSVDSTIQWALSPGRMKRSQGRKPAKFLCSFFSTSGLTWSTGSICSVLPHPPYCEGMNFETKSKALFFFPSSKFYKLPFHNDTQLTSFEKQARQERLHVIWISVLPLGQDIWNNQI